MLLFSRYPGGKQFEKKSWGVKSWQETHFDFQMIFNTNMNQKTKLFEYQLKNH